MTKKTPEIASSKKMCVYCGSRKRKLTKDHIPPKCLFAKPLPQDLITVPCCLKCNKGASKDDEYFRSTLVFRRDAGEHAEAKRVVDSAVRSLQRPEARGFANSLLGNVSEFFFKNEHGVIEPGASYHVDLERLDRVASRVVKGLFWKDYGKRLPDEYMVSSYNDSGIQHMDENQSGIVRSVLEARPKTVGNNVFRYWQRATPEDNYTTLWILLFYKNVYFLCFTLPNSVELERSRMRSFN